MKLIKLSLVAALAAGSFSTANALDLAEIIKDIDVNGALRYRYNTGRIKDTKKYGFYRVENGQTGSGIGTSKQTHNFRASLQSTASIADNFKAFLELNYNSTDDGYSQANASDTKSKLEVRQYYLTYTLADYNTNILFGKQQLNTIWTDNETWGLVGTGAKIINQSIDGLTLAAFAVDSFDTSYASDFGWVRVANGSTASQLAGTANTPGVEDAGYTGNLYGAGALGSYEIFNGTLDSQAWLAYFDKNAFYYALDLKYNTIFANDIAWELEGAYLGNSVESSFKKAVEDQTKATSYSGKGHLKADNGNFFGLRGTINYLGFDATLGGLYYGNKSAFSFNVIQDQGNIGSLLAGREIFYTDGSNLSGDVGQNLFGFVAAGYKPNEEVRLGVDVVYGGTKVKNSLQQSYAGGEKLEIVPNVSYKYSPKLAFEAWYSYLNIDGNDNKEGSKKSVRVQALYKF